MTTGSVSQSRRDGEDGENGLRVFMSYRRSDDPNFTGRFHDKLVNVFGDTNVFRDIDSLAAGTRFAAVINERLDEIDAVVALIGPSWAGRLESPTDFVRMEIAHALAASKPVIPVLIEDTALPERAALPPDMQALLDINAVRVRRDPDFHRDAARVIAGIRENVRLARELQAERQRREEEARAEQARAEQQALEERERQAAEARRREAERQEAEEQARQDSIRRQLAAELARVEAEAAEKRRAAEALERERLERLAELARLEEEATRRQIADERLRLSAVEEAKQRRDEEVEESQARARELREQLARSGPLEAPPAAATMPPPPPPLRSVPETAPARPAEPADAGAERPLPRNWFGKVTAHGPFAEPVARSGRPWILAGPAGAVAAICLAGATLVGIAALFVAGEFAGGALNGGPLADVAAFVLTLGLLAPCLTREPGDAAAVTFGVLIGYVCYQALPFMGWFWEGEWGPWGAYYGLVTLTVVLAAVGFLLLRRRSDGRALGASLVVRVALLLPAVVVLIATFGFLNLWIEWYSNETGNDLGLPRLLLPLVPPAIALVALALSRRRRATLATAALAGMGFVVFVSLATGSAPAHDVFGDLGRGEFTVAALAAAVAVVVAVWSLGRARGADAPR